MRYILRKFAALLSVGKAWKYDSEGLEIRCKRRNRIQISVCFRLRSHEIKPHVLTTPWPLPQGLAHSRGGIIITSPNSGRELRGLRRNGFRWVNPQDITHPCLSFPTCRAGGLFPSPKCHTETSMGCKCLDTREVFPALNLTS